MAHLPSWLSALQAMRFAQLLFFSIGTLLLQALFHDELLLVFVAHLLLLNALLVTLSARAGAGRWLGRLLVGMWLLMISSRLLATGEWGDAPYVISKIFACCLLATCIVSLWRYETAQNRITIDAFFAAIVIYVLIALLFAQLYSIAGILVAGSFAFPPELELVNGHLRDVSYNYFSFVTIATLGYGDIVPRHPLTQMLASIEAVVGQFYVAIIVARQVSLYGNAWQSRGE